MGGVVKSIGNAVGGILGTNNGTFFNGERGTVDDQTKIAAWNNARPTLDLTNSNVRNLINDVFANPSYSGQRVAGLDPTRAAGANSFGGFLSGTVNPSLTNLYNTSQNMVNAGANFGTNANNIFNQYGTGDQIGSALAAGNQFANNPYVNGLIDASSRDVTRNLYENQLTGLNRNASGTGNLNSTRAGVESAITTRGAADRLADLSSTIRSQFFNNGVNQYNQNLTNALSANKDLLNSYTSGFNGLTNTSNLATNSFNGMNAAGSVFQDQRQAELDAQKAQYDEALRNRLAVLTGGNSAATANQGFGSAVGTYQDKSGAENTGGLLKLGGQVLGMFS